MGWSGSELADAIGGEEDHVVGWEAGSFTPSAIVLPELADRLGVSLDWLLAGRGPMRFGGLDPDAGTRLRLIRMILDDPSPSSVFGQPGGDASQVRAPSDSPADGPEVIRARAEAARLEAARWDAEATRLREVLMRLEAEQRSQQMADVDPIDRGNRTVSEPSPRRLRLLFEPEPLDAEVPARARGE
jgi:transcriptional regulator with XRE-family HTH domain